MEKWTTQIESTEQLCLYLGLVDYRFAKVHMLKESSGPFFFASLLPTFCRDSTATLRDLTVALYVVFLEIYGRIYVVNVVPIGSEACKLLY
ncbi:uncharacterized protein [Gossypium hirsutum]|uniref:Uncharacterized protein isoform X2 n=1 Tax=Gossypium hirsutum TaxID=3635 RepID=A0ABM3BMK4_GOSHI|nr:uncharacterized protein LOC107902507 isoform X2 [Gossypium hirsutum]